MKRVTSLFTAAMVIMLLFHHLGGSSTSATATTASNNTTTSVNGTEFNHTNDKNNSGTEGDGDPHHHRRRRPVWNILHGNEGPITQPSALSFKDTGVLTLNRMKDNIARFHVNAVELDMIFHVKSDQFYLAHDQYACDIPESFPIRAGCYELVPYLQEVEVNPNITMLWVDPKGMHQWGDKTLGDLAVVVRAHVKTKEIWWGLGAGRSLQDRDLETLAESGNMGPNEGVSFDYGKCCQYRCTVQDLYLRARRAGITNVGYANKPGFFTESCFELNKALAYRAEGNKISRVFIFTYNDEDSISKLYKVEEDDTKEEVMSDGCGIRGDEEFIVAGVDGVVSNAGDGVETHANVIAENEDSMHLSSSTKNIVEEADKVWQNQTTDGNLIANFGAEMPTLSNYRASSWKWMGEQNNKPLSYSEELCDGIPAHTGFRYFAMGQTDTTHHCSEPPTIFQDTVIRGYEPEIVAGLANVSFSAYFLSPTPRTMSITIKFLDDDAKEVSSPSVSVSPSAAEELQQLWVQAGGAISVPSAARIVRTILRGSPRCTTTATPCAELIDTVSMMLHVEHLANQSSSSSYDWKSTRDIGCCEFESFDVQLLGVILCAICFNVVITYYYLKTFLERTMKARLGFQSLMAKHHHNHQCDVEDHELYEKDTAQHTDHCQQVAVAAKGTSFVEHDHNLTADEISIVVRNDQEGEKEPNGDGLSLDQISPEDREEEKGESTCPPQGDDKLKMNQHCHLPYGSE